MKYPAFVPAVGAAAFAAAGLCYGATGAGKDYLVITDQQQGHPYYRAAVELSEYRDAPLVRFSSRRLADLRTKLRAAKPKYVAIVTSPHGIDCNSVAGIFSTMRDLDADPEVDVAHGFITGMTADDALALVKNTMRLEAERSKRKKFCGVGHTFGGKAHCFGFIKDCVARFRQLGYETVAINPNDADSTWEQRKAAELAGLDHSSVVFLSGHGEGDQSCLVFGRDLVGKDLTGAIVMNGTCYGAVTSRKIMVGSSGRLESQSIKPSESFCLNCLHSGAVGYLGSTYSSALMNVYPAFGFYLQNEPGLSLGQAVQKMYNWRINQARGKKVQIKRFLAGGPNPFSGPDSPEDMVQAASRVILLGDPAYVPYPNGISTTRAGSPAAKAPARHPEDQQAPLPQTTAGNGEAPCPAELRRLIDELSDPKAPRFVALREIIAMGSEAVPALIAEMGTNNNWQIPKALGAVGDKRAVRPLIDKLQRCDWSPMREVVVEALQRLTGEDFGSEAEAWRNWWNASKKPEPAEERDTDPMAKRGPASPPVLGMAFIASEIGRDYGISEVERFVNDAGLNVVVIDFAYVTHHWLRCDFGNINRLADRLAHEGVQLAAMYRPRKLSLDEYPEVPVQLDADGKTPRHPLKVCFSTARGKQWCGSWALEIASQVPGARAVIVYNPLFDCHCAACEEGLAKLRDNQAGATWWDYRGAVLADWLADVRSSLGSRSRRCRLGVVTVAGGPNFAGLAHSVDLVCPFVPLNAPAGQRQVPSGLAKNVANEVGERLGKKPVWLLIKVDWANETRNRGPDVVEAIKEAAACADGLLIWHYGHLRAHPELYDLRQIARAYRQCRSVGAGRKRAS